MHSAVVARTSAACGKLSRRLHETPGSNAVFLAKVASHERILNLDEVEGDQALLLKALTIVRRFRSDATAKTKWLSEVLHICSLASRPETAQEILRQARASDADAHNPLTCEFTERPDADLVKIAAGDVSINPQDLLAQEAIMHRIPVSRWPIVFIVARIHEFESSFDSLTPPTLPPNNRHRRRAATR